MTAEPWLRRFLLAAAAATHAAAAAELVFVEHYEGPWQVAPFGMIAVGLVAVAWAWAAPSRGSLMALRWAGALAVVGSLIGVVQHAAGNLDFAREVSPGAGAGEMAWEALSGGYPLLAPGMIALAGLLAAAATYRHSALAGAGRALEEGAALTA